MTTYVVQADTLGHAIEQLVEEGIRDPIAILDTLETRYGADWLADQTAALYREVVTDRARNVINARRRSATLAITPGKPMASERVKQMVCWTPASDGSIRWKEIAEFTADDHDARAEWMDAFAAKVRAWSDWHRKCSALIRKEGVVLTGELRELPPMAELPEIPMAVTT